MSDIELAYMAGVLDSDGCICISRQRWRERNTTRARQYTETISVTQISREALDLFQKHFGGNVVVQKPRGEIAKRPIFKWQTCNSRAVQVVRKLMPYLRVKRPQAEVLVKFRSIQERGRKAITYVSAPRVTRLRPEVLAERSALAAEMRRLNGSIR